MIYNENGIILNEGFFDRFKKQNKNNIKEPVTKYTNKLETPKSEIQSLTNDEIQIIENNMKKVINDVLKKTSKIQSIVNNLCKKYQIPTKFVTIYKNNEDIQDIVDDLCYRIKSFTYDEHYFMNILTIDDVNIIKYLESNSTLDKYDRYNNPAYNIASELADTLKSSLNIPDYCGFGWEDDKPIILSMYCNTDKIKKELLNK